MAKRGHVIHRILGSSAHTRQGAHCMIEITPCPIFSSCVGYLVKFSSQDPKTDHSKTENIFTVRFSYYSIILENIKKIILFSMKWSRLVPFGNLPTFDHLETRHISSFRIHTVLFYIVKQ